MAVRYEGQVYLQQIYTSNLPNINWSNSNWYRCLQDHQLISGLTICDASFTEKLKSR